MAGSGAGVDRVDGSATSNNNYVGIGLEVARTRHALSQDERDYTF